MQTISIELNHIIENAKIINTLLGFDRGFLSSSLFLEYDGGGQAFGGYNLNEKYAAIWIKGILEVTEKEDWGDIKGCFIRVDHSNNEVYRIGHIIKDIWFDPKKAFKEK